MRGANRLLRARVERQRALLEQLQQPCRCQRSMASQGVGYQAVNCSRCAPEMVRDWLNHEWVQALRVALDWVLALRRRAAEEDEGILTEVLRALRAFMRWDRP